MLLELVFAAAVALVIVGALVTTSIRQTSQRAVNLETTLATNAALDVFARLRAAPFASLPSFDGSSFDVPSPNGGPGGLQAVPGDPDGLPGHIAVGVEMTAGATTLYRVTVTVAWASPAGRRTDRIIGFVGERKR